MKNFLKNYWFILAMLIAIVAGCIVGAVWPGATALEPLGTVFINLMFCVVVPMVFCSIASAIANMGSAKRAGKVLGTTVVSFMVTAAIAAVLMYIVVRIFPLVQGEYQIVEGEVGETLGLADMVINFFTKPDFIELWSRRAILPLIRRRYPLWFRCTAQRRQGEQDRPAAGGSDRLHHEDRQDHHLLCPHRLLRLLCLSGCHLRPRTYR